MSDEIEKAFPDISEQENPSSSESSEERENPIGSILKKRKQKRHLEIDQETEDMIDSVLNEARQASEEDVTNKSNGLPALQKLRVLNKFIKILQVPKYHETLLDMNVCTVLKSWLSQLPDGSFPCLTIRTPLLEIIKDMPILIDHLTSSELGQSVMALYKNPKENAKNKRLLKSLIDKWSKLLYGIDTEYARYEMTDEAPAFRQDSLHNILLKESTRFDPTRGLYDFKYMPAPKLQESRKSEPSSVDQILKKFKRSK